jgi:hypothetical protein
MIEMKWQPIETAPKNPAGEFHGPIILIFYAADNLTWPAYWAEGKNGDGTWFIAYDGSDNVECALSDVTHWMPLPEKPTDE